MPTTIAFDLDDTLYKEIDFVESGRRAVANAVASATGIGADKLSEVMAVSDDAFDGLLDFLTNRGITSFDISGMLDVYRTHIPDISLDASAHKVVSELKRRGTSMALITDGRSVTQRNKIKALGLEHFFPQNVIHISGETGADKHTPVPYMNVAAITPKPRRLIYVGDNPAKDFVNANLSGWTTIMLRDADGVNIHPQHLDNYPGHYRPQYVIDDLCEILNMI